MKEITVVCAVLSIFVLLVVGNDLAKLKASRLPGLECSTPIYARDGNMRVHVLFDQVAGWDDGMPTQKTDLTGSDFNLVPMNSPRASAWGVRDMRMAIAINGQFYPQRSDNSRIVCVARAEHRAKH